MMSAELKKKIDERARQEGEQLESPSQTQQ